MNERDLLQDQVAVSVEGWAGELLDACINHGVMAANYSRYAQAFAEKKDSNGEFHGEFWGKWFTSAAQAYLYRPTPQHFEILRNAVQQLLAAQEPDGRLSASATDFTVWDLWGRKYALLGLVAFYDVSGDKAALNGACRMLDDLILHTQEAGVRLSETGLHALQGLSSCSLLQPVVQVYARTQNIRYLQFAESLAADWSLPSAVNPRGLRLLEDALEGVPPVRIAAPKGYEVMSCWEGVCELYRCTGKKRYLDAVLAYMENVLQHEIMITGSGSSAELWCEGRYRQTQLLEAPMETCVTATYMKLCHQLLRLTGEARWADQLEISLFNALAGAMQHDGSWWAYFNPLLGQRVLSQVQLPYVGSSCCVVNGPRALTEVPLWALMRRKDGFAVCLYQPGEYRGVSEQGELRLKQRTDYPREGKIFLTVKQAPAAPMVLALRLPAWSGTASLSLNGKPLAVPDGGWYELRRAWQPGDELCLELNVQPRIVCAPHNEVYKALMAGPVVLGMDNRLVKPAPNESLWLMNDGMHTVTDAQLDATYYPPQSLEEETAVPLAAPVQVPGAHVAYRVQFLKRPIHFWHHEVKELTLCDYAFCGSDFAEGRSLRVWFPQPFYSGTLFPLNSREVISIFSAESENDTL